MRHVGILFAVSLAVVSLPAAGQTTTGRFMASAVDESGAALPGVTVTIDSPALIGGVRTNVTDDRGEAVFLALGPGEYTVRASLVGFTTQERSSVKVPLGGTAVVPITMPMAAFAGDIEVTDEVPVVDTTQINTGQVFREDYMQGSAIGSGNRDYTTIVNQAAGVVGGNSWAGVPQPRILGSSIGDNAYFIDGMDATNPVMATATTRLNFDAIGEIQLQTGGFEAEYGRATGGIINLVSKSGGNRFSGSFDVRYRDNSFQENGEHFDPSDDSKFLVAGATLGGPIVRDRVWFFASVGHTEDVFTPAEAAAAEDMQGQTYLAKITWQIDPGWRLAGKYTTDPTTIDNWGVSRTTLPEASAFKKGTTTLTSTELNAVLSDALMWNTTLGRYHYLSNVYPIHGDLSLIGHYNWDTDISSVSRGNQQYWDTSRLDLASDLTWFVDDLAGSHEFKGGIEVGQLGFTTSSCNTGTPNGERCVPGGVGFYFNDIGVDSALPFLMWESHTAGETEYDGRVSTAFVQDAWRPRPNLTIKAGLRYDLVSYDTNNGTRIADLDKLQPRLGVSWDLTNNAKNILRGSWGRFMHPNMMTLPSHVRDLVEPAYRWYSCTTIMEATSAAECAAIADDLGWDYRTDNVGWDPFGWVLSPDEVYASEPSQADPDMRASYADELVLAFEREVGRQSSIELTYLDKKTRDLVDDTCNGNWPTPSEGSACDSYFLANFDELRRDYRGLTLTFETRRWSWLSLLASYTYSSSKGSIEYSQNGNWEVDLYPWHYESIYGYMSDHRRHRIKLNGFVTIPGDWSIAFDARWTSAFPWAPVEDPRDIPEMPWGYNFVEPWGSRAGNSNSELDLQLSKGFRTGGVRFVLIGTVLNAFGTEQVTEVCPLVSGCGFDDDGSPIDMGDPTDWQTPRRYEVG
ncbi:MAG: TonB-dependent receptor, partial [Holophagae bacterium]